jgi:lysophospholipase L1-like esterase
MTSDRTGVPALATVFGVAGLCVAATYTTPGLADWQPWHIGDPLPVVGALLPKGAPTVVEDVSGAPVAVEEATVDVVPVVEAVTASTGVTLPPHPPGVPTPLVDPDHRGMDAFFRALHATTSGSGVARASQWGDSTIAADGITSTVRQRLQARFGDGGPGYLSAGLDPEWSMRLDVAVTRHGDWATSSLLNGGGDARYGFGGIVSTASPEAYVSYSAPRGPDGTRVPMKRFEVWYQTGPERGSWWASVDGRGAGGGSAAGEGVADRWSTSDVGRGYTRASFGAGADGPATFYGIVMETGGPGVVWDALGVVGVGTHSFTQQGRKHLNAQVAHRKPDLTVVMLGGNELGNPSLKGDGSAYVPYYQETLGRLRGGAPTSSCLVITPLDQGTREGGAAHSKPTLVPLIAAQRQAAAEWGCAFWDARDAMGGEGAITRWVAARPPLAWTDLLHLSSTGQDIIGQLLADAILADYDAWVADGGPARPASAPPGPAAPPVAVPPAASPVAAPPAPAPGGSP